MVLTGGSTAHFPEKQLVHGTTRGSVFGCPTPKNTFYLKFFFGFFVILKFFV